MPQDRMTDMLQQKALRPWTDEEAATMFKSVHATKSEKNEARGFESHSLSSLKKEVMFGFPHNKEGIGIATASDPKSAKANADTKGIFCLQNNAKGLFRLQDLWYASALMATKDKSGSSLTKHILYGDQSKWNSAFVIGSPYHEAAKSVSDAMADMWYEPLAKAYISGAGEDVIGKLEKIAKFLLQTWKTFFQNDMGAVNNMLINQVQNGNLKYIYAGTWEAQNLASRGIKTYVNPFNKLL